MKSGLGGRQNEERFSGCLSPRQLALQRALAFTVTTMSSWSLRSHCSPHRTTHDFGPGPYGRPTGYYDLQSRTRGWVSPLSLSQSTTGRGWLRVVTRLRRDDICPRTRAPTTEFSSWVRLRNSIYTIKAVRR